jgi:hypothetical protein
MEPAPLPVIITVAAAVAIMALYSLLYFVLHLPIWPTL